MKKHILLILTAVFLVNLCSCTENALDEPAEEAMADYSYYNVINDYYTYNIEVVSGFLESAEKALSTVDTTSATSDEKETAETSGTTVSASSATTAVSTTSDGKKPAEASGTTVSASSAATTVPTTSDGKESTETSGTSATTSTAVPTSSSVTTTAERTGKSVCIDVPYISQRSEFPTGCEIVSATMLLQYYKFDVTPGELIDKKYIPCKDIEYSDDDKAYFPDPEKFFIGNPRTGNGYGCYAPVIFSGLEKYLDGKYFDVVNLSGTSLADLCSLYIDFDEPVLIWASISMVPTELKEESNWFIKDSKEKFRWHANEHCLVLVGYDDDYYYFNDPLGGAKVKYSKSVVEERYKELEFQAVTIRPW